MAAKAVQDADTVVFTITAQARKESDVPAAGAVIISFKRRNAVRVRTDDRNRSDFCRVQRKGSVVTTGENKPFRDVAGRCEVTLDGVAYDTVCLMDFGMYDQGTLSEQFIGRDGRTVLWRRFNQDDWALDRYGKTWSAMLPVAWTLPAL